MTNHSVYRPDIDGLRAVAVLAVLIFHAFPEALPGGFVGVDVFFVISGYLITSIILRDVERQQFSLRHFYAQRIRRIFPALLLVLLFCLGVGWLALTSGEYRQLGRYTGGGAAFVNNFLFWRDAGYFDNAADTKPLLHLWSLAIEEQFYIVWPLLLMALAKISADKRRIKSQAVWVIAGLLVLSLAFSIWQVKSDTTAAFYSPLSRSWELLVGAALAAVTLSLRTRYQHYLSWLGVVLLMAAFVLIDKHRAFPGAWALLPTLGAACLIAAGPAAVLNQSVLSSRPMVWVGLISYPLYLWHVPLLSFARIFEAKTPSVELRLGLLLTSVVLAYLTYRWLERPIRAPAQSPARKVWTLWCLSLGMLAMLFVGHGINMNDGFKFRHYGRLNADANTIVVGADRGLLKRECGLSPELTASFEWCLSQNKTAPARFAIVGDSKAEALYYGLARESKPDENWLLMGSMSLVSAMSDKPHPQAIAALERLKADPKIEWVVLSNSLFHLPKQTQNYVKLIDELRQSGKKVMIVIDNPTLPDPNSCIEGDLTPFKWLNHFVYRQANPECKINYQAHLVSTAQYSAVLDAIVKNRPNVVLFDTAPYLCDIKNNICTYFEGKQFLYSYGNHISDYANSKIAKQLLPLLR